MQKKEHLIYWVYPLLIALLLISVYYLNPLGMGSWVAPQFNREFGILENLQLVFIAMSFVFAYQGYKRSLGSLFKRGIFISILIITALVFLEEMDYGLHYYNAIMGIESESTTINVQGTEVRNIHNIGKTTHYLKLIVYAGMILLFVVLPWVHNKKPIQNKGLQFLIPSAKMGLTLLVMFAVNQFALQMESLFYESGVEHALKSNVSEFEELLIYYIGMLYIRDLKSACKN